MGFDSGRPNAEKGVELEGAGRNHHNHGADGNISDPKESYGGRSLRESLMLRTAEGV